jgi:hypothetical protein
VINRNRSAQWLEEKPLRMGPCLPPSLKLRRAQLLNPGEALAETGRRDDDGKQSAAAANAVNLTVQFRVLVLHLLKRLHGRVASRLSRFPFRRELGFLPLIAGFTFRLGLNEAALFHRGRGRSAKHQCGA